MRFLWRLFTFFACFADDPPPPPSGSLMDQARGAGGGGDPPPADPPPGATPPAEGDPPPSAYDWQADSAGLGRLDLKGSKLLGKYESVKALEDSYQEVRKQLNFREETIESRLKEKYSPPEAYDFSSLKLSEDTAKTLGETFRDLGLTQEAALKAVPLLQELVTPMVVEQNLQKLGERWGGEKPLDKPEVLAKLREVDAAARRQFGDAAVDSMEAAGAYDTPESIVLLDSMLKMGAEGKLWNGGRPVTGPDGIKARLAQIESDLAYYDWKAGQRGVRYEELHKERTELYEKLHGEEQKAA
jgi:hypothetical protein